MQTCCGRTSTIFKTDQPITIDLLKSLVAVGFKEYQHFTSAGILYLDNIDFIITGPLGSDRLQVKCKKDDCLQAINDLEMVIFKNI